MRPSYKFGEDFKLKEYSGPDVPKYTILLHTWGSDLVYKGKYMTRHVSWYLACVRLSTWNLPTFLLIGKQYFRPKESF